MGRFQTYFRYGKGDPWFQQVIRLRNLHSGPDEKETISFSTFNPVDQRRSSAQGKERSALTYRESVIVRNFAFASFHSQMKQ